MSELRLERHDARPPLALAAVAFAFSMLPIMVAGPVPAMCDYTNHLARMAILAKSGTPGANVFYREAWGFYPNLAMDLLTPPIARWIGPIAATRLFLVVSQALIVSGALTLERVVKGRFGWAAVAASMLLYSLPFAWGFVNFEFALGLALFALAGWIALGEARPWARYTLHASACLLLFIGHLFALGVYGWAVGLYEVWRWRVERLPPTRLLVSALALGAPAAVIVLATRPFGGAAPGATQWDLVSKLFWPVGLDGYSWRLSAALSLTLMALGLVLAGRGRLRLIGAGPILAIGFLALYVVMPHRLFDTEFVDVRVVAAAALILPAFTVLKPMPAPLRTVAIMVTCAVAALDLVDVTAVQASYRSEYTRLFASFRRLPPHARVLVGLDRTGAAPLAEYPIYHAPVMAAGFAGAFVPTLFAAAGKQPIAPRADLMSQANPNGGDVPVVVLAAAAEGHPPVAPYRFAADWPAHFDDLYVIGTPGADPLPHILRPLARGERFTLYAIVRPTPQSASR